MIIHYVMMGLLIYLPTIAGHPALESEQVNVSIEDEIRAINQLKSLPDPIDDSYSHVAVDTLVNKIVEISTGYRNDINGTISDVQHIIQTDSSLPQLTRGEIIELLENLTNISPEIWKEKIEKSRKDYQRAIMLVMPYTPKTNDILSIEELYTKPPITHIIGAETTVSNTKNKNMNKHVEIVALAPSTHKPPTHRSSIKPMNLKSVAKQDTKVQESYPLHQKRLEDIETQEASINSTISSTRKPPIITQRPELVSRVPQISNFKPEKYSNHRYPGESEKLTSNEGIRIIKAPSLVPKPFEISKLRVSEKEIKPGKQWQTKYEEYKSPILSSVYKAAEISTVRSEPVRTSTHSSLSVFDVPEDMKDVMKDVDPGKIEIELPKYSSQYDASSLSFSKQDSSTENVLLDSIDVLPQQTSTLAQNISEISDALPPDMKDLLMSFGLIDNQNNPSEELNEPIITQPNPEVLDIDPYSYTRFKPLPDSEPSREDMQQFLAGFGLTGSSQRSAKKLETPNVSKHSSHLSGTLDINLEMIPENMREVLEDIGLSEKEKNTSTELNTETHIFNPEQSYVSETEIKRLNQLFETIKKLEKLNRTATPDDLKDLDLENIRELTKILKEETSVPLTEQILEPNPLDFDSSLEKNEFKRQQSTTTSTEKAIESVNDFGNFNLAALYESFGGNVGAAAENVDESLPPPRKTGFYYLADWNTFLEVGEEGKNKVNIRFSPQAGDSSRFLRVKIP